MSAIERYDAPYQFEPLLPSPLPPALLRKAAEVVLASARLTGQAHPAARTVLRELLRSMNSYYSNRIEGHGTHPRNIERALRSDFSERPEVAQLQRVALAHISAERELEQLLGEANPFTSAFLIRAHAALYSRLGPDDRLTADQRLILPGVLRSDDVTIGRHLAPTAASVAVFLERMDQVYAQPMAGEVALIATACLHHRAAWVHPFLDGNGRALRLQSHCALWPISDGLWSPVRGIARSVDTYYAYLQNADMPRRGDLYGRGNLTTAGLLEWVHYFVDLCGDQVAFMSRMLNLDGMRQRMAALIAFRAAQDKALRSEAVLPLHHLFAAGPLMRGEFCRMTGLGERTARKLLSRLLATGLVASSTPLGPVHFALPLDALSFLLPELYPEAATAISPAEL